MPTQVTGTAGNKLFNAALFTETARANSFVNMMTEASPTAMNESKADGSKQTSEGAPCVRITNLAKEKGDEVTVDLYHQQRNKPVMGDANIAGKMASMTSSQFDVRIDQGRTGIDSGGRMAQQRTKVNLKRLAKKLLRPQFNALQDQICLTHLAGARGYHEDADWIVPLESDPDFGAIMVNTIAAPTYDRHFFGGDATAIDGGGAIDATDTFTLRDVDNIRLRLDEMPFPLQPVKYEKDPQAEDSPFYVLCVSPRQWYDFWVSSSAGGGGEWRALQANVEKRSKGFNHRIFLGECVMWHNILVRKMTRPIRFTTGSTVTVSNNDADATTTTATAATNIDRAILLGGQAIADAYGRAGEKSMGGHHFYHHSELVDHGNRLEQSIAWMNGKKKFRFRGTDGRINDHGVAVLDTAVSGL